MEFRWESDNNYRKLYYVQTSTRTRERSDYYLMLRPKDRKTAILKLSITVPDYFNAKIRPLASAVAGLDVVQLAVVVVAFPAKLHQRGSVLSLNSNGLEHLHHRSRSNNSATDHPCNNCKAANRGRRQKVH